MIGQHKNREFLSKPDIPRVIILEGNKLSGRKTLARWFADELRANYTQLELNVADVRVCINIACKCVHPTVYIIENAEELSDGAQAALLKLLEEPPQQAYFVLICEDVMNISNTLRSRSCVLFMEPYTVSELRAYIAANKYLDVQDYLLFFRTLGEIKQAHSIGAKEFVKFCKNVCEQIYQVPLYNALKVTASIKTKEDGTGYDPDFFLKTVAMWYAVKAQQGNWRNIWGHNCMRCMLICSKYRQKLKIKGIKKDSLIDNFILEVREVWNDDKTTA